MLKLFFGLFLCCSHFIAAYAASPTEKTYAVVVDAGSTGSRLHVYSVTPTQTALPVIQEIYKQKDGAPIASFAAHPEQAGPALNKLLTNATAFLVGQGVSENEGVPIYVYSTAGMRLIPEQDAHKINHEIREYILANYPLFSKTGVEVRTIAGSEEAFFAWASVNEAAQTLNSKPEQTVGIVEMGGASSQVAFAVDYTGADVFSFELNGEAYNILSKSFLGVGHAVAMKEINNRPVCYPLGAPVDGSSLLGQYDYTSCHDEAVQYLNAHHIHQEIGVLPRNIKFYGLAAFYYSFTFFGVSTQEQLDQLKHQAQTICSQTWDELKSKYSDQLAYLKEYCFSGAYDHALLSNILGFAPLNNSPELNVSSDKINGRTVEWAEGFVVSRYLDGLSHSN